MNRFVLFVLSFLPFVAVLGQTNVFPLDGNVGIGTTNPISRLHVVGYSRLEGDMLVGHIVSKSRDFSLGQGDGLPDSSGNFPVSLRALVHSNWNSSSKNELCVNYGGDYTGGVFVQGKGVFVDGTVSGLKNTFKVYKGNGEITLFGDNTGTAGSPFARLNFTSRLGIWTNGNADNDDNPQVTVTSAGNVGIGTANPTDRLSVNGIVRSKEVKVDAGPWPDYVFSMNYNLPTIDSLEIYLNKYGHLPGVPTAADVQREGAGLGEMNRRLLEKVEELTLYIVRLNREVEKLKDRMDKLK